MWRRRCHRFRQRNKQQTCPAEKTCCRSSCVVPAASVLRADDIRKVSLSHPKTRSVSTSTFSQTSHSPVCEEHIDDLSQFVSNTSRIQLFQDAALIGKAVKEGTAKLGLTLSGKSTLLASVWRHQPLTWVSKPQWVRGDVLQTNGNAYGKAEEGPRELTAR